MRADEITAFLAASGDATANWKIFIDRSRTLGAAISLRLLNEMPGTRQLLFPAKA